MKLGRIIEIVRLIFESGAKFFEICDIFSVLTDKDKKRGKRFRWKKNETGGRMPVSPVADLKAQPKGAESYARGGQALQVLNFFQIFATNNFFLINMNIFEQIFRELNKIKVQYLVVGGVAVNLHGFGRFTADLDLLILLEEENLKKIQKVMKLMGYSERLPISVMELSDHKKVKAWQSKKNLKAYTFNPPRTGLLQVDIVIDESLKFKKLAEHKVVKYIHKIRIPVVSIQDLILMKKKANRTQDTEDVKALLELKKL